MVKLYMLLVVAGEIGGTFGPLPYDMAECLLRAEERAVEVSVAAKEKGLPDPGFTWRCVERAERPQLGDKFEEAPRNE